MIAKNNAKQIMYSSLKKIEVIKLFLKKFLSVERYSFRRKEKKIVFKESKNTTVFWTNLGPRFVPANKNLPFMDIITSTESCSVDMEYNHKVNEAETTRQNVSNTLQKNLNLKIRSNQTEDEEGH